MNAHGARITWSRSAARSFFSLAAFARARSISSSSGKPWAETKRKRPTFASSAASIRLPTPSRSTSSKVSPSRPAAVAVHTTFSIPATAGPSVSGSVSSP